MRERRMRIERLAQLGKIPAFDHRELLEHHTTGDKLFQYCACAGMRRDLVSASLNAWSLPEQPQIPLDQACMAQCALLLQMRQDDAQGLARVQLHPHRLGGRS